MRNDARFIPGEEIEAVAQWNFGAVDTTSLLLAAQARAEQETRDRGRDEELRQEAYAQGFAQGHAHALVQAEQQVHDFTIGQGEQAARNFAALLESADQQLAQSQQVMAQGVLDLACALARQVLRQELSVNPNVLQPVIREALGLLADDSKSAMVRLNPLDLEMLQDVLKTEFAALSLTLVADAAVKPGACLIASAGTVIDGSLDTRWRRAVASLGLDVPWAE